MSLCNILLYHQTHRSIRLTELKSLIAILQESEAKLEMKFFEPPSIFLCGGRLLWEIDKNHIWMGRCIIALVTALDDVGLRDQLLTKNYTLKKLKYKTSLVLGCM